jgi:hypothetical protein
MPVFTLISSGQQALERMGIKCLLISACSVVILRKRVPNAVVVCFVIFEKFWLKKPTRGESWGHVRRVCSFP